MTKPGLACPLQQDQGTSNGSSERDDERQNERREIVSAGDDSKDKRIRGQERPTLEGNQDFG